MKFIINRANDDQDNQPCKGTKPIILKGTPPHGIDVTRWTIELKTARQFINLAKRLEKPLIIYPDKTITIYDGWIE